MKHIIPLLLCFPADEAAAGQPASNDLGEQKALKAEAIALAHEESLDSPGVSSTLAVMEFLVQLAKVAESELSPSHGKITFADITALAPVVPTVMPMIAALHNVPAELAHLDEDEIAALIAEAAKAFPGQQNALVVAKVKAAVAFAKAGYDAFVAFKS